MLTEYRITVARPGVLPVDISAHYIIEQSGVNAMFRAAERVAEREGRSSITLYVQEWKTGHDKASLSSANARQDEVDLIQVVRGDCYKAHYIRTFMQNTEE